MMRMLACLAKGLGIRATARVFEVDPNTVLSAVKGGEFSEDGAMRRLSRSPHWVWTAMDPETKLLLVIDVGTRTLAMAQRLLHQVAQCFAPHCVPLFLRDGFKDYLAAILGHFGFWVQPDRRQATGPSPKPRWMPLPGLLYARVIKTTRRRRLVRVTHRVVLGTLEAVEHVLAACGWQINTAFVERLNLDIRQRMAAVGRRVATLCKGEGGLQHQLVVFHAYHYTAHLHQNGPRLYKLSRGYDAPEVAAAVERIGAEQQAKRAA